MTPKTDSVVEDRIRGPVRRDDAGHLERTRRSETILVNCRRRQAEPNSRPDWTVDLVTGDEQPRRGTATLLVLASCVVLVVLGVVLFSRRVAEVDEIPANSMPAVGDVLLFPSGAVTANELDQVTPGSWSSAVQTPTGLVLGINASADFWGELPPDADVRTIGGLTVGRLVGDSNKDYVALSNCAMLNVATPTTTPGMGRLGHGPPDRAQLELGCRIRDAPGRLEGAGHRTQTEYFNTAFTHTIGTSSARSPLSDPQRQHLAIPLPDLPRHGGTGHIGTIPGMGRAQQRLIAVELSDLVDRDHSGNARRRGDKRRRPHRNGPVTRPDRPRRVDQTSRCHAATGGPSERHGHNHAPNCDRRPIWLRHDVHSVHLTIDSRGAPR